MQRKYKLVDRPTARHDTLTCVRVTCVEHVALTRRRDGCKVATMTDTTAADANHVRVGLDLVRAAPGLRAEVLRLVAAAGLHLTRVILTVGARSVLGPREVTYSVVDVAQDFDVTVLLPMARLMAGQWTVETRPPEHLHVVATGVKTWLVVSGDMTPPPNLGGPPGGQTPPIGAPIAFKRAA